VSYYGGMGRGPGHVERAVARHLAESVGMQIAGPFFPSAQLLTSLVFGCPIEDVTPGQLRSVKRALRRLQQKGAAFQFSQHGGGRRLRWSSTPVP
jgi:hypothetical protein